jgi:hypothetical protein
VRSESGFTLVELLVSAALLVLAIGLGTMLLRTAGRELAVALDAAHRESALTRAAGDLSADAASAFAVWLPDDPSCAGGTFSRVAFFRRDERGTPIRWEYASSAGAVVRTLTFGSAPALIASVPGLAALSARCVRAGQSGWWPAAGGYAPADTAVPLAAPDAGGAIAGNRLAVVTLHGTSSARTVHLLAGVMPGGFTVVGVPSFHAVVYRVDQTHRSLFGLVQKSHVFIRGRVDVSYDGFRTRVPWCSADIYPDLDPHSPLADYRPNDPNEQSDHVAALCRASGVPLPPP